MALIASGHHRGHAQSPLPHRLRGLGAYAKTAMANWKVPGLAIAVVQDGELILSQGYGVLGLGNSAPVDAESIFPIASCTKSFTAAAVAKLVDVSGVQWNDAIGRYLPELQLFRPNLVDQITIRHALSHRTGLPTANMLWRNGALSSDDIVAALRWLEPVAEPGERFLYNNNMYLVAGKIVEAVSQRKWSEFIRGVLFEPLGMKSTACDSSELRGRVNVAVPHAVDDGILQRIQPYSPDAVAPAGVIHSNALDLARWVKMQLHNGRFEGQQILSAARIEEMHARPPSAQVEPSAESSTPRAPISNYGLGWFFNDYAGQKVVEHAGTSNGFVAWIAMVPQEQLGFVILSNQHRTGLNYALRHWILDACLGRQDRDWSEIVRADFASGYERRIREAKADFDMTRRPAASFSCPLADYAGDYESKLYGRLQITFKDNKLGIRFGTRFDGTLNHWKDEAFRAFFPNPRLDDWLVTFSIQDKSISRLHIKESPWAPAWYEDADDLGEFQRLQRH